MSTEKLVNFKVLLYTNRKSPQEESSSDRFVWFLPNDIPVNQDNSQLFSFLTSRDFHQKPLNFEERLRKFTLFADKAKVFIFAILAGAELKENQGTVFEKMSHFYFEIIRLKFRVKLSFVCPLSFLKSRSENFEIIFKHCARIHTGILHNTEKSMLYSLRGFTLFTNVN